MAVVSLVSAKGSPGATTLAVALTLAWAHHHPDRRTVLVDADPVGGDVASGVLRGQVPTGSGMLALAAGRGQTAGALLDRAGVPLTADGAAAAVCGVPDSQRAGALAPAWAVIEAARTERDDLDLVVDAGRLDSPVSAGEWLVRSDQVLMVVRPGLPAVTAARRLADAWAAAPATAVVPLQLVVVDAPSPYSPRDVAAAVGRPLLATIPFEEQHAVTYSAGAPAARGLARSRFVRAIEGLAERLDAGLPIGPAADRADAAQAATAGDHEALHERAGRRARRAASAAGGRR